MKAPIKPIDEKERLASLKSLKILDTPINQYFEKITRITQALFKVPIVAISLVDDERQWFKSIIGIDVCETSREISFCGHAILQDDIFIINDALKDERFVDNPLVIDEPKIRFYAGFPVRSDSGYKIGTLCIIDRRPRKYSSKELSPLIDLASLVGEELRNHKQSYAQVSLLKELDEVKRNSYIDNLTRAWNRGAIEGILFKQILLSKSHNEIFGVIFFDIDNFKRINDTYGHNVGDNVIRQTSKLALSCLRENDALGRWGGEEFLIIINSSKPNVIKAVAQRVLSKISNTSILVESEEINFTVSMGVMAVSPLEQGDLDSESVIEQVDKALYRAKQTGKNKIVMVEELKGS